MSIREELWRWGVRKQAAVEGSLARFRAHYDSNLQLATDKLPPSWDNSCAHPARRAAAELTTIMTLKGYTPAEVGA